MTDHAPQGRKMPNDLPEDVVATTNPHGVGPVILVCEHATNALPPEFNGLGLSAQALQSHIAWDLGALAVAEAMSAHLDAPLIAHRVSRLAFDCNRSPQAHDAIPDLSEFQKIPGNTGLSAADREARAARYYTPFCDALSTCIEQRMGTGAALPVLVTVHSFTPTYKGEQRAVEIGILHDDDARLANEILRCATANAEYTVLRNAPYGPEDGVTFTLARHAIPRGLLNVMVEIRNDLIATEADQGKVAKLLAAWVRTAVVNVDAEQAEQECEAS